MADNDNRDIRLKDAEGNYLYPLAREDDKGRVFQETYLNKLGEDSYICNVEVKEVESPETGIIVKKLILTNKQDPDHPIEFLGGDGGYATWGFITGDINDQGDLSYTIKNAVEISLTKKNKIFKQATIPESSSECSLIEGDLWYVTGDVEGYTKGKWYTYSIDESGIPYWAEVTDIQITENSAKITLTDEKLATEVTERKQGEAKAYSTIEQTAHSIKSEVGITRNRFFEPEDEPPVLSSELLVQEGDLWYCSVSSGIYEAGKWYICRNASTGVWEEATEEETRELKSVVEQTAEGLKIEVKDRKEAVEGEATARSAEIKVTADTFQTKLSEETTRAKTAEDGLGEDIATEKVERHSEITQTASEIRTAVTEEITDAVGAEATARHSEISQTAESITAKVTAEETRAIAAEGDLNTAIETEKTTRASEIKQTADSITAKVEEETTRAKGEESKLSSTIEVTASEIRTEVKAVETKADGATTTANTAITQSSTAITQSANAVTTANGAQTTANTAITQSATAIEQSASAVTTAGEAKTESSTAIKQSADAVTISSQAKTTAEGAEETAGQAIEITKDKVSFTDLKTKGKTEINGNNLKTGTVTADYVVAKSITAGSLKFDDGTSASSWADALGNFTKSTSRTGTLYAKSIDASIDVTVRNNAVLVFEPLSSTADNYRLTDSGVQIGDSEINKASWESIIIAAKGGGAPTEYIKSATSKDGVLTLEDQNGSTITYQAVFG